MRYVRTSLLAALLAAGIAPPSDAAAQHAPPPIACREDGAVLPAAVPAAMSAARVPGLALAVACPDGTVRTAVAGVRHSATGAPVDKSTLFEAASLTKPVFAWLALRLWEDGRLELDTPLADFVPADALYDRWFRASVSDERVVAITARMVLTHTSGVPSEFPLDGELRPLEFDPGTRFGYSSEGFNLLQRAVEYILGAPLEEVAQELLFEPLGMARSSFIFTDAVGGVLAAGHDEEGRQREGWTHRESAAGWTLYTTPADYGRFLSALLLRRGLRPTTYDSMFTPQVATRPDGPVPGAWGLGVGLLETDDGPVFWQWGNTDVYRAFMAGSLRPGGHAWVYFANGRNGMRLMDALGPVTLGPEAAIVQQLGRLAARPSATPHAAVHSTPADPDVTEAIVYTTLRPANWDIWLFEAEGGPPSRLTNNPALDYNAVFSPAGRWIVFTSERGGNADLYAFDLEDWHAPAVRLTRRAAMDDAAAISPDGSRLAFVSTRDGVADIFVMPFAPGDTAAEAAAVNLTRGAGGFNPAFSPDGRRIAFSRAVPFTMAGDPAANDIGNFGGDVFVMDLDGGNVRRLSQPGALSGSPAWSLDGKAIYYHRVDFESAEIRVVAADGSDDVPLVPFGLSPAVRPDGRVGFFRLQPRPGVPGFALPRTGHIYSVAADGSDLRLESDTARSYFAPDFDRGTGRMVTHGRGPDHGMVMAGDGFAAFAPPETRRTVLLPDRTLAVRGIRGGDFPALTAAGEVISSPVAQESARSLNISAVDGHELRELFRTAAGGAWGAAVARDAGTVVVAVGPPFAFPPFSGGARVDIWRLDADGSNAVNLTADSPANDALPHISADGRRIVFRSDRDGGRQVHIMDGDGQNVRRLSDAGGVETMPALSPDGEWVVFSTDRAGGMQLYLQHVDGSKGRFVEPDRVGLPEFNMHPRFSPDGRWIVFTSSRAGFNDEWPLTLYPQPYGELWAVPVDGGPPVRLTNDKWEDGPSDWGYVRLPSYEPLHR